MGDEPRSRWGRRCCRRRQGVEVKLPETPLILAGALGGPFCIFVLTPLRNALTLASQDAESYAWELYKSVFAGGFASAWTGGTTVVLPSCPQFIVMGPLYHFLKASTGSAVPAVMLSAFAETCISYGSQTVNAQMAFNAEQRLAGSGYEVPIWNPFVLLGPGCSVHILRNIVSLSGLRIFSGPCLAALRKLAGSSLSEGMLQFLGDFTASMGAAVCSAPLNQLYNFSVTSNTFMAAGTLERASLGSSYLLNQYLVWSLDGRVVGVTPTLGRDLFMRCAYVATLYAMFGLIERIFTAVWKSHRK
eukprot:TRINITY_DN47820_c0_g1_i1.p1 TRINITY_DN47820_c0_g1~~TRINITY_DN47820_c0_g1_i1.p1  ORF type:complete len:303 (-),score=37.43 TRINITY_DN47820_c0_g1_i1:17-925(-)